MDENDVVAQADVNPPVTETVAEKTEPEKPEVEQKPSREDELQRAVAAANQARRRAERDLAEQRLQWETANQRLAELAKRFQTPEKTPDPTEDPVGAITHETKSIKEKLSEWEKREEERQKQEALRTSQQAIERQWSMAAQSFAQKQPDFPQAYDYLFRHAVEEYQEAGYDEQTVEKLTRGYWHDIVVAAQRDGINPAERMYNLAKRRGYKASRPQEKIDTVVNGTKATSPLASASGKAPARLTAEVIANMSQEEFDKLSDADFKRIFG